MYENWKTLLWGWVKALGVPLLVLMLVGALLKPLSTQVWEKVRAAQPELSLLDLKDGLGQGMLLGVFGGFRSLIADFVWISGNGDWEKRDRAKTETMIHLALTLDPTNSFFWRNGARILAYDIPVWRLRDEMKLNPDDRENPMVKQVRLEQCARAFELLDKTITREPNNPWPYTEKAQIYNLVLKDTENAAIWFGKASALPRAPYFAGRIRAELLVKMGKVREAYDCLLHFYNDLPTNDPYAARDFVYDRLRELEDELKLPQSERMQGERPAPLVFTDDHPPRAPQGSDSCGHDHAH